MNIINILLKLINNSHQAKTVTPKPKIGLFFISNSYKIDCLQSNYNIHSNTLTKYGACINNAFNEYHNFIINKYEENKPCDHWKNFVHGMVLCNIHNMEFTIMTDVKLFTEVDYMIVTNSFNITNNNSTLKDISVIK